MKLLTTSIIQTKNEIALFKNAPKFVPAGQSTQLIVGATPESDKKIITLSEGLYNKFSLKRVFYSAYIPVSKHPLLSDNAPALLREHRLYQADWLLRYYGFKAAEILSKAEDNLNLNIDPKCQWALKNIHLFPIEINKADYEMLLRIPGIGVRSAQKIFYARKISNLDFYNLKKMNIVLKRAKYFITCNGKMLDKTNMEPEFLERKLSENKINQKYDQLNLFDIPRQG